MTKQRIIIHHSATADGSTFSWGAIRRYHMAPPPDGRGWDDIGYHYGIELVGSHYEILLGRMPDLEGAHCKELGMNVRAIGVCLVGNFDIAPPPASQVDATVELCRYLMRTYSLRSSDVLGHREVGQLAGYDWRKKQYKSCPGELFNMNQLRFFLST